MLFKLANSVKEADSSPTDSQEPLTFEEENTAYFVGGFVMQISFSALHQL